MGSTMSMQSVWSAITLARPPVAITLALVPISPIRLYAVDQPFDKADVAPDHTRLHGVVGVFADAGTGGDQLDAAKLGGEAEERIGRDTQAGRDSTSQVVPFGRDYVERGGSAEVYYDSWAAVAHVRSQCVHDAVSSNFAGIFHGHLDARLDTRLNDEKGRVQVILDHFAHSCGDGRHDA